MSPQRLAGTILADIRADPVLTACRSFTELHDHIDANTLGDQEAYAGDLDLLNQAQELVTATLSARL